MQEDQNTQAKRNHRFFGRGRRHRNGPRGPGPSSNSLQPLVAGGSIPPSSHSTGRASRSFSTANTLRDAASDSPKSINRDADPDVDADADPDTDTPAFKELAKDNLIDPVLLKTVTEDMGFQRMTPVQAATIHPLLTDGHDMLAQAKTGTGKTVAFLLPAIQKMLRRDPSLNGNVSVLVLSPTRELALQIAAEARALLQNFAQYSVGVAIGGTKKPTELNNIMRGCDILVATPGRLLDHLSEPGSQVAKKLQYLDTLVLDEADRLLDMGFLKPLEEIVKYLPERAVKERQSLLFSATIASHVQKVAQLVLSKDYKYISTIPEGELGTHERVPQHLVVAPTFSDVVPALIGAIREELAILGSDDFKAIVFVPTARVVDFYAEVLQKIPGLPPTVSLHSRLAQGKRTRITQEFREARSSILIATDVVARGMDFPSVTNVFQAGIPSDKESYIHRLGRTARAGAEGRGHFIIASGETPYKEKVLKDITFVETQPDLRARKEVLEIARSLEPRVQEMAYQGWLGYYKSYTKPLGWDVNQLVAEANKFALEGLGAPEIPALKKPVVGKMGLKGVPGIRIAPLVARGHPRPRDEDVPPNGTLVSKRPKWVR